MDIRALPYMLPVMSWPTLSEQDNCNAVRLSPGDSLEKLFVVSVALADIEEPGEFVVRTRLEIMGASTAVPSGQVRRSAAVVARLKFAPE
jgi:hypothetical protein